MDIAARRHCRAMVRVSITKLANPVNELECKRELTHSDGLVAQRFQQKLTGMDGEFKRYHLAIADIFVE